MREIFKSYHLFIPGRMLWLKLILLYIVAPIIMCALALAGSMEEIGILMFSCMILPVSVEMLIDMGIFNGIERKESKQTVFLRLQERGLEVLKKGLWGDFLRRVFVLLVPAILVLIFSPFRVVSIWRGLWTSFASFLAIEILLFVSRAIANYLLNILITSGIVGFTFGFGSVIFISLAGESLSKSGVGTTVFDYVLTFVLALLIVTEAFFRIRFTLKQARKGYYD